MTHVSPMRQCFYSLSSFLLKILSCQFFSLLDSLIPLIFTVFTVAMSKSNSSRNKSKPKNPNSHWSGGLLKTMKDPEYIVIEDELVVAIKDMYPKAKFHYLVCPKEDIASIKNVSIEHLHLLKHMHDVGKKLSSQNKEKNFLLGYHSVPSMIRLHLHVISDDFDSVCLKTKKHWNSFTTPFFLSSENVIKELEYSGKISDKTISEAKGFISKDLKCHKCDYMPKNMPDLKQHIKTHIS